MTFVRYCYDHHHYYNNKTDNKITSKLSTEGGVGKGKLITFSIPIEFICKIRSSTGLLTISGSANFSNSSLNTLDEYNL